jgi:hypothetical protein
MFFGGPDDREALELGGRMAEHPVVKVTIVRFVQKEGQEKTMLCYSFHHQNVVVLK